MHYFCIRFRERKQRWFDILTENGVGALSIFFLRPLIPIWIKPWKRKKKKITSGSFGSYGIKFLPLHPLLEGKAAQAGFLSRNGVGYFPFPLFSLSTRETTRRKKKKKNFLEYLERISKTPYLCIRFPKRKAVVKRSDLWRIYINNTSSTRARAGCFGKMSLGKTKRTVNTYIYR